MWERDVNKNFDEYYSNRLRDINYNPHALERDLDLIPYDQLTDRQKSLLDQDKKVFYDFLIDMGEKVVMTRRARKRIKTVEETYQECKKTIPYEIRNKWIEGRIEQRFKYFDQVDDLQNSGSELEIIRRKLQEVNAALKLKCGRVEKEKVMSYMSEGANKTFTRAGDTSPAASEISIVNSVYYQQQNPFLVKRQPVNVSQMSGSDMENQNTQK